MGNAFGNAIALVTKPADFMRNNKDNDVPVRTILVNYVAILALITLIATFLEFVVYYAYYGLIGYAVAEAIATYVLDVVGVFVIGFIVWKLGPNFGTTTTQDKATLLAAFLYTPIFLISILNIIPFLGILSFLGLLYGLYILYIGLPILFNTPQDKVLIYVGATVVVSFVVFAIIGYIVGVISVAMFLHSYYPFY
jgi:hypothetical protein